MEREKHTRNKNLIVFAAGFYAAVMVAFPAVTEAAAKSAISVWLNSVAPVLLPFFIFADFIKRTADLEKLPVRAYPMVMAFLSGYPMGAKIAGDLVKEKVLSPGEACHVLSYSLVTGPAFILGTAGIFLGSTQAAAITAIAHYGGAFCNGIMWRSQEDNHKITSGPAASKTPDKAGFLDNFTDSILSAFRAMAIILAYMIIFMIGADLLEALVPHGLLPGSHWKCFLKGLMEMTVGISGLGMCQISLRMKTVLTAFVISFGGLSVIGQSVSVAGGWLRPGILIKIKITHGLMAGIIAAFTGMILL